MLKWIKRIGFGILALIIGISVIGVPFEQWSRRSAALSFLPPGEMIEFGGALSHLQCLGEGSPTVILEAGGGGGSQDWVTVQPALAPITRVCSYDRAGHLWSEERGGPRDAEKIASELHSLLEASSETAPFIMVGHSVGSLFSMVFSQRYKNDVVGLVLVDPMPPDAYEHVPEILPPDLPAVAAIVAETIAGVGILRLSWGMLSDGAPQQVQEIRPALYPQSTNGFSGVTLALRESLRQAGEVDHFGDLPMVVLSSSEMRRGGLFEEDANRINKVIRTLHAELAGLSTNSVHRIVAGAGHYIHWDKPEAVVTAIRDVLWAVRKGKSLHPPAQGR